MKRLSFVLLLFLVGCASHPRKSELIVFPEVRRMSSVGDALFQNILLGPGGVGAADLMSYPAAQKKTVTRIEVLRVPSGRERGEERWYVDHDGKNTCSYLVTLVPDALGNIIFKVHKE